MYNFNKKSNGLSEYIKQTISILPDFIYMSVRDRSAFPYNHADELDEIEKALNDVCTSEIMVDNWVYDFKIGKITFNQLRDRLKDMRKAKMEEKKDDC